jgi:hypothetical protein
MRSTNDTAAKDTSAFMNHPDDPKYKAEIHRLKNAQYERCLWHTMTCSSAPIKAHAIQNSRALEVLAEDGHVVMVKPEIKGEEFGLPFKRVGRNLATTFTGMCLEHDTLLFRAIDTNEIDPTNAEHSFLVAYRAVLKGLHAALAVGQMIQLSFHKGVELGHFSEVGPEMTLATVHAIAAMQMFEFSQCFHQAYKTTAWDSIVHVTLCIPTLSPALAASGVCLPVEAQTLKRKNRPFLVFSIFPQNNSHFVQFSWLPEVDVVMRLVTKDIITASGDRQLHLLSKFILKYTETFTLKPSVYESFSRPQVDQITKYFLANAAGGRKDWDDPKLYLFGPLN